MNLSHNELKVIYNTVLDEQIKKGINEFMEQNLDNQEFRYSTSMLWKTDLLIGGIGGYCMPANPVENPFISGIERELYRPLQYARSDIDICDVRIVARYVVESSGMHLEAVCRLFLKKKCALGGMRFSNTTLGKAVHKIKQQGIFEKKIIESLYNFVAVYNRSKHEINQDESRSRMFNAYDAIVAYFTVRILGIIILQEIGIQESFEKFKICIESGTS